MALKRSEKRLLTQIALYLVLAALIFAVVFSADFPAIRENFFNDAGFKPPGTWGELILTGAKNTILYTAIAFIGGLLLAMVLALMKMSPVLPYRWLATAYIEFFRGLPVLLVILTMALGVPIAFQWTPPGGTIGAGLLALIMVAGAYMAETLRAGIQAVPKGQTEAARSLGMGPATTMITVTLPQAFRIVIPPLTNEFVLLLKDTALVAVAGAQIGERDLTQIARDLISSGPTAGTATSMVQAAILYLIITLPLTRAVAWLEKKQQRAR